MTYRDPRLVTLHKQLANTTDPDKRERIQAQIEWIAEDQAEARQEREEMEAGYGTFARPF